MAGRSWFYDAGGNERLTGSGCRHEHDSPDASLDGFLDFGNGVGLIWPQLAIGLFKESRSRVEGHGHCAASEKNR
jgi:hypothetical protein